MEKPTIPLATQERLPRTRYIQVLDVVLITTRTHDRRKSIGKKKQRKEKEINERKDKNAKNEKGKERKEKTRKARKDKTRGRKREKKYTSRP